MAKTFYTLEEAAKVLGKPQAEVRKMAERGELTEFKDRDQLVFKKDQVDMLSDGPGGSGIGLADSGLGLSDPFESLSMEDSKGGSGLMGEDQKDSTGISIFDPEATESADPAAQTQVSDAPAFAHEFGSDAGSSGSGLLDLTREADDTSLGADLLDDVYGQDTVGGQTSVSDSGAFASTIGGDLFESTGGEMEAVGAGAMAPAMGHEAYDGAGSGLVGGLALGMCLTVLLALGLALLAMTGVTGGLIESIAGKHFIVAGVLAVLTLILGGLGWFLGRKG